MQSERPYNILFKVPLQNLLCLLSPCRALAQGGADVPSTSATCARRTSMRRPTQTGGASSSGPNARSAVRPTASGGWSGRRSRGHGGVRRRCRPHPTTTTTLKGRFGATALLAVVTVRGMTASSVARSVVGCEAASFLL